MTILKKIILLGIVGVTLSGCAPKTLTQTPPGTEVGPTASTENQTTVTPQPAQEAVAEIKVPQAKIVGDKHIVLTNFNMENKGKQIKIKPGTSIHATLNYVYDCKKCDAKKNNQIIIGLAGRSAQACIYNGNTQGQGSADFYLKVPAKPGKYDVRYRGFQAADCNEALQTGWHADNSPVKTTTIGTVIVSRKADA